MQKNMAELNLLDVFYYMVKRCWIIAAAMLVFAGAAFVGCRFIIAPEYTASARIYVLSRSSDAELEYTDLQSSEKLTSDFEVLITGRNITSSVIEELDLDMTDEELAAKISVTSPNSTRVLQISVNDGDADRAAEIANAVLDAAVEQIVLIMEVDALNVVYEAVVPTEPSSPNTRRDCLLSALAGGIAADAVILLRFALDDAVKTEEDVTKYLGMSTMGIIPKDESSMKLNHYRKKTLIGRRCRR